MPIRTSRNRGAPKPHGRPGAARVRPRLAAGIPLLLAAVAPAVAAQAPEVRIKETDYQKAYAAMVALCEAAESTWKNDPAGTRRRIEEEVLARTPEHVEVTLVVTYAYGINKGAEKERHGFHPHRLAGQCALAAGDPAGAVSHFEKAAGCEDLLGQARAALQAKQEAAARPDLPALLAARDYAAALGALRTERARFGDRAIALEEEIRRAAASMQREGARAVAAAIPRLDEESFREGAVAPFLAACARVPGELELPETRWIRALDAWLADRAPARRDVLAIEAASLDPAFHAFCRFAQEARLHEIRGIVEETIRAPSDNRPPLLARLARVEQALETMAAARAYEDLRGELRALKARLPVDLDVLRRARAGATSIAETRALAGELERTWASRERARLSESDAAELARHVAVARCLVLFLDGRRVEEAAADYLVQEAFRAAAPLPEGVNPKVAAVRARIR